MIFVTSLTTSCWRFRQFKVLDHFYFTVNDSPYPALLPVRASSSKPITHFSITRGTSAPITKNRKCLFFFYKKKTACYHHLRRSYLFSALCAVSLPSIEQDHSALHKHFLETMKVLSAYILCYYNTCDWHSLLKHDFTLSHPCVAQLKNKIAVQSNGTSLWG